MATMSPQLFTNLSRAHKALTKRLDKLCQEAITEYNQNPRNHTKLERCRIHMSNWHPDEERVDISFQLWVDAGWSQMAPEEVLEITDRFDELLRVKKRIFAKNGFTFSVYIQNVDTSRDDE